MDSPVKPKEENPISTITTTTTVTSTEEFILPTDPPTEDPEVSHPRVDTEENVGSTSTAAVETAQPTPTLTETTITKPTVAYTTPATSEPTEPQGTKRPQEPSCSSENEPSGTSSSDDTPKAKRLRKEDESVEVGLDKTASGPAPVPDKEEDTGEEVTGTEAGLNLRPANNTPAAPKVPPIKIVLQGHGVGNGEADTMAAVSQPHVVSTTSSGFPYIVSSVGAETSGTLSGKDKSRGTDDVPPTPKAKADSPIISEGGKEKTGGLVFGTSESPKRSQSPLQSAVTEGASEQVKSADSSSTGNGANATVISAGPTVTFAEDRIVIDGTQSPSSLLGKEKPTRVTRSSQRIATTVHSSPSPNTSPKNSACSSPNQMEVDTPPPNSGPIQVQQVTTLLNPSILQF